MELLNKWINKVDHILGFISGCTIFLMMIWIFTDVILRYFFNHPIVGTMEITGEYFMAIIVYVAISYTQKEKGHINVDFLQHKFSKSAKRYLQLLSNLLAMLIFIILDLNIFQKGIQYFEHDIRSVGLIKYPLAPALMIISLGLLLLCIRLLFDSIQILRNKIDF